MDTRKEQFIPSINPIKKAIDEITQMRDTSMEMGGSTAAELNNLISELGKNDKERTITPDQAQTRANQIMGHIDGTV
jgi:hypothetical protein